MPWLGFFDPLVTRSAQEGYYAAYLFDTPLERLHLSLQRGTTALDRALGPRRAREVLRERARLLRAGGRPAGRLLPRTHRPALARRPALGLRGRARLWATTFTVYEGEVLVLDPKRGGRVLGYLRLASAGPDVGHFEAAVEAGADG